MNLGIGSETVRAPGPWSHGLQQVARRGIVAFDQGDGAFGQLTYRAFHLGMSPMTDQDHMPAGGVVPCGLHMHFRD